jgi:hypothetical protein
MALDNYADLQTTVGTWLRRSDLAAQIPDFIVLAEAQMNRTLRTSLQLVKQPYQITGELVNKPTGFRMMRSMRLAAGSCRHILEVTPEQMNELKATPAVLLAEPRRFAAVGLQFEFWPVPNQPYPAVIEFQSGFMPLSDANPINWILADHPDTYLTGALMSACAYLKDDERAQGFKSQFMATLADVQQALRTSYDRLLRSDPGIMPRRGRRGAFNILTGE